MTTRPIRFDFYAHEGDLFHEEIQFTHDNLLLTLTGITFRLEIKKDFRDEDPLLVFTTGNGIQFNDDETAIEIDADAVELVVTEWLKSHRAVLPPVVQFVYSIRAILTETRSETWVKGLYNYEVGIQR